MNLPKAAAALADPVRIAMLKLIANPPGQPVCSAPLNPACDQNGVCVCEFSQHLRISQPRASYHLRILREAGLIVERPRGKWTYYGIASEQVADFCRELKRAAGIVE